MNWPVLFMEPRCSHGSLFTMAGYSPCRAVQDTALSCNLIVQAERELAPGS